MGLLKKCGFWYYKRGDIIYIFGPSLSRLSIICYTVEVPVFENDNIIMKRWVKTTSGGFRKRLTHKYMGQILCQENFVGQSIVSLRTMHGLLPFFIVDIINEEI